MAVTESDASKEENKRFAGAEDPLWHSILYGLLVGGSCIFVGYPLDTIKVRLQTGAKFSWKLLRNPYRGVLSPLACVVPSWSGNMVTYAAMLKLMNSDSMESVAIAGGISGLLYASICCPFEYLKCNTQRSGISLLEAFRAAPSWPSLYRGFGVTLCRDVGQAIMYYVSAEYCSRYTSINPFVCGIITGVAHCTVEFPFDTIKTRIQTTSNVRYKDVLHFPLFRGYPIWIARAVIAHGTSFCVIANAKPYIAGF